MVALPPPKPAQLYTFLPSPSQGPLRQGSLELSASCLEQSMGVGCQGHFLGTLSCHLPQKDFTKSCG
jgi:hypothetical protein